MNPGLGIHSPKGCRYYTPAILFGKLNFFKILIVFDLQESPLPLVDGRKAKKE